MCVPVGTLNGHDMDHAFSHFSHVLYLYILVLLGCTFQLRHRMGHLCILIGDHTHVLGMQPRIRTFIFPCCLIQQPLFPNPVTKGYLLFCTAMCSHGVNCTVHAQSSAALHSPCTVRTESCTTMHSQCTVKHSIAQSVRSPCTVMQSPCQCTAKHSHWTQCLGGTKEYLLSSVTVWKVS